MERFIEKSILDRNGNPKTIKVRVGGDGAINENPRWRGLEYGWTADDVSPETPETAQRQNLQEWATRHGGEVVARHVKLGRSYVPIIYAKDDLVVFATYNRKTPPRGWQTWLEESGITSQKAMHHNVSTSGGITRHHFGWMS